MKEKIRYISLPKRFVAGSVVFGDRDECAENVKLTLIDEEGNEQVARTNNYGDFEFEDLPKDKAYTVRIQSPGYKSKTFDVKTKIDVYLGDIFLERVAITAVI